MPSRRIIERVRMVLENRFNITLSDVGTSLHQPITRFYSQLSKKTYKIWNNNRTKHRINRQQPPEIIDEKILKNIKRLRRH